MGRNVGGEKGDMAPASEIDGLAELDCWRTSTILDVFELKLLKSKMD